MEVIEIFLWGICGGVLAELAGIFEIRRVSPDDFPEWLRSPVYWIITCLMVLGGGLLVVGYARSGANITAILAVNIGASAPLIIRSLSSGTIPLEEPQNID